MSEWEREERSNQARLARRLRSKGLSWDVIAKRVSTCGARVTEGQVRQWARRYA